MLLQVVWSAWLSTLGHAPSVMDLADSDNVHHFTDSASALVDKFVPVSFQVCLLLLSADTVHTIHQVIVCQCIVLPLSALSGQCIYGWCELVLCCCFVQRCHLLLMSASSGYTAWCHYKLMLCCCFVC